MRFFSAFIVAAFFLQIFSCERPPSSAPPKDGALEETAKTDDKIVIAKINEHEITLQDFYDVLKDVPRHIKPEFSTPSGKKKLLDKMIARLLLFDEGVRAGLPKEEDMAKRIMDNKIDLVSETVKARYVDKRLTERELKKYYAKNKGKYKREGKILSFEAAKPMLNNDFKRDILEGYIEELKSRAELLVDEKILER